MLMSLLVAKKEHSHVETNTSNSNTFFKQDTQHFRNLLTPGSLTLSLFLVGWSRVSRTRRKPSGKGRRRQPNSTVRRLWPKCRQCRRTSSSPTRCCMTTCLTAGYRESLLQLLRGEHSHCRTPCVKMCIERIPIILVWVMFTPPAVPWSRGSCV